MLFRDTGSRGFSIIEVVVSSVIIMLTLLFVIHQFRTQVKLEANVRHRTAIGQVEDAVRNGVFDIVKQYYQSATPACDLASPSLASSLSVTFPSGIVMSPLTAGEAYALAGSDLGFNQVLARCATSPLASSGQTNQANSSGVYFCVKLTAPPTSLGAAGDVASMQPFIAEFSFFLVHLATYVHGSSTVSFGPLPCASLTQCLADSPPHGVLGELFYNFNWTPGEGGSGRAHLNASGLLARGAGGGT